MALTIEQIKSLKAGDKVVITESPGRGHHGNGEVGKVLTVSKVKWSSHIFCEEFFKGRGAIESLYVDLVEEKKMFTKNDLKSWMRVKTRGGIVYIVDVERGLLLRRNSFERFKEYNNDLTSFGRYGIKEWDIVQIFAAPEACGLLLDPSELGEMLWERTEETGAQKQYKVLKKKMKELQEEMDKLQPLV